MTQRVWYAAYGSNLSRARFEIYLSGGRPEGASHTYPGCRDRSAPGDDVAGEIDAALAFGGTSKTWGGGVAFVRMPGNGARARLYLLTLGQFCDVVAQENWLQPGSVAIEPCEEQIVLDGDHSYRVILPLGERDGVPVMTISQPADIHLNAPTDAYLRHISDGLREAHGMSDDEIADYLRGALTLPD